tara:strand:+ start:580 stop:1476 length:897 start_codon:yes stop_codon:yes gene_type:complete
MSGSDKRLARMTQLWPTIDFEDFFNRKVKTQGYYNPGFDTWQMLQCTSDGWRKETESVANNRMLLSIHHPYVVPWKSLGRDQSSNFLDPNQAARSTSLQWLTDSVSRAKEQNAQFVLTHLTHGSGKPTPEQAENLASRSVESIARISESFNMPIHIEYLGYHPSFHLPEKFISALEDYPNLGLCLDTGHLNRWAQIHNMDPYQAASKLSPLIESVHLWNTSSNLEYRHYGHVPVHNSIDGVNGYISVERILQTIAPAKHPITIIFEPSIHSKVEEAFITEGMLWIKHLWTNLQDHAND